MSQTSPYEKIVQPRVPGGAQVYWRVEGSFLELSALRQVGFFTWNAQSFAERWRRRTGMALMTLLRPVAYLAGRTRATRLLYMLLRGVTRDRLDLLGEEYFEYFLKSRLQKKSRGRFAARSGRGTTNRSGRPIARPCPAASSAPSWGATLHCQPHGVPRRHCHWAFAVAGCVSSRALCVD